MAKKPPESVFDIAFTKRDEEIRGLELQKSDIEQDLDDAINEFLKLSKKSQLKLKKKRIVKVLRDSKDPDKL